MDEWLLFLSVIILSFGGYAINYFISFMPHRLGLRILVDSYVEYVRYNFQIFGHEIQLLGLFLKPKMFYKMNIHINCKSKKDIVKI
jgi:hypothetical protein